MQRAVRSQVCCVHDLTRRGRALICMVGTPALAAQREGRPRAEAWAMWGPQKSLCWNLKLAGTIQGWTQQRKQVLGYCSREDGDPSPLRCQGA